MVLSSLFGALVVIIILGVVQLNRQPDLSVWHKAELDEEFRANSGLNSFDEYLELEDRLFEQLDRLVYQEIDEKDQREINRYHRGSLSDPDRWPTNWNRSFVLPVDRPVAGILLLHGMSDSPYSMRSIGQALHGQGAHVIGMRVPGHGQAPSGLVDIDWQDMAAAVRLAMDEIQEVATGLPLYIVGYSNGAALAVQYTLDSLTDDKLKVVDGLILMSPEIGVTKLAALAKWQERLGHLLGLEKLAWNSIQPEYDPWKYGSFALNAGKQAYLITQEIQGQITALTKSGELDQMPPILAFQSVVDSTVTAPALVHNLFDRLSAFASGPDNPHQTHHELVLFDINRWAEIEPIMNEDPSAWIDSMLQKTDTKYMVTLMSNMSPDNNKIVAFSRAPGSLDVETCDTGLSWPEGVYSLSHVALPMPADDPVYGGEAAGASAGIELGNLALRGEKGVLRVPAADMLRLRHNPFHGYMLHRVSVFLGLESVPSGFCIPSDTA